ncbi:MAG: VWA domain-containing protein [Isosphaeraceae bacterium]
MRFAHPGWLLLLVLIPLPLWLERARPRMLWPSLASFPGGRRVRSWRRSFRFLPGLLRGLAIGALGVALARPQSVGGVTEIRGQGVAIVVALDQSSSMSTADFPADHDTRRISRLEAARATLTRFVEGRPDDLIGLVVFANYPDLAYAPTLDHRRLIETAQLIRVARPGDDGTNIGYAIDWALGALRDTTPSKKVLVLLTDGNNEPAGPRPRDPEQAAGLARDLGITIHTIAIGQAGGIVRGSDPNSDLPRIAEVEGPNLELLGRIASITGGRSFVATNTDALDEVFQTINALEKSLVTSRILTRYDEHFAPWAALALGLLVLDRLLVNGWLRRLP